MARERIVSAQTQAPEEERFSHALRPESLEDYIGQPRLVEKLSISLTAAKQREEPMEHVLLHGPPGLGKTTLAHIIATEMGGHLVVTSGPAITKGGDLVGPLTSLNKSDVLFIDEIHRLSPAVEEYIYPAMEDFKVDVTIDQGMHAKTVTLPLQPFTLIGATTRAGLLSGPMRSRFGISHSLEFYNRADLLTILNRSAGLLGLKPGPGGLDALAERARGTPRIANRLLRRVRDFAQVRSNGRLDRDVVDAALELEGIDALGLDAVDHKYMRVIAEVYRGGPVGLEAIAATLGEDSGTLEEVVEPYLLQIGFLARTRRGRQLTHQGGKHIGVSVPEIVSDGDLSAPSTDG